MKLVDPVFRWLLPVGFGALVVVTCMSVLHFQQTSDGVKVAAENLARCRQLARQIEALQKSKSIASENPISPADVSSTLLQAAQQAGVLESQVQEIQHLPSVHIANTDFRRDDTVLRFSDLGVVQLAKLLLNLQRQSQPSLPTSLTLNSASNIQGNPAGPELWATELVLTRLTFAAQSAPESPVR